MSVQFVLGPAGSGKTTRLLQDAIDQSRRDPGRKYLIIVPEQFSLQTQQELVRMHPCGGALNMDVLSFKRLACNTFEELNIRPQLLSETGKNLLVRRAAAACAGELTVLSGRLDRQGYVSQIKSLLSELDEYGVTDDQLEDMAESASQRPYLQAKLRDIRRIRQEFDRLRSEKITGEELLKVFAEQAGRSEYLAGAVLIFDSFTGFTPVQMMAMRALMKRAAEIRISLTIDGSRELTGRLKEQELFYMSRRTIRDIREMAREETCEYRPEVWVDGSPRWEEDSPIRHLRQHFERYDGPAGKAGEAVRIRYAPNPEQEVRQAASAIRDLADLKGLKFSEIAVITGSPEAYEHHVRRIFDLYDIPCFMDHRVPVRLNPCFELLQSALALVQDNFAYSSVMRLIRTGLAGIEADDADLLENYLLAAGIRGRKRWEQPWTRSTRTMDAAAAAHCEALRREWMGRMTPFLEQCALPAASVRTYVGAVRRLMTNLQAAEQMEAQSRHLEEMARMGSGEPAEQLRARAAEYRQVCPEIERILGEMESLLGDETISCREFGRMLDAGIDEAKIALTPPGLQQVHVGDMTRTRLGRIRALFFLGVCDGWVPSSSQGKGVLGEMEREFLYECGYELAPTARQDCYTQQFYLYLTLTRPSEYLALSWCGADGGGEPMRPSAIIGRIRSLLPDAAAENADSPEEETLRMVCCPASARPLAADQTRRRMEGEKLPVAMQALIDELQHGDGPDLNAAAAASNRREPLSTQTARRLYGEVLAGSVSRLETYAACPYKHFAEYGLRLQEREKAGVAMTDIGSLMHDCLEAVGERVELSEEVTWEDLAEGRHPEILDECLQLCLDPYRSLFEDSHRSYHLLERVRRILERTLRVTARQIKAGRFTPYRFEAAYPDPEHETQATVLDLGGGRRMKLRGRIDRVDLCRENGRMLLKVIDYKTGTQSFDLTAVCYGLQLQLLTYLSEAVQHEQALSPDSEVIPAGVFYAHVEDPVIEVGEEEAVLEADLQETLWEKAEQEMRPDGLVNAAREVLECYAEDAAQLQRVLPIKLKGDGSLNAASASAAASTQDLRTLSRYVSGTMTRMGREILEGRIDADPYEYKGEDACSRCDCKTVCRYDRKIPGSRPRRLRKLSSEQVWERVYAFAAEADAAAFQEDEPKAGEANEGSEVMETAEAAQSGEAAKAAGEDQ